MSNRSSVFHNVGEQSDQTIPRPYSDLMAYLESKWENGSVKGNPSALKRCGFNNAEEVKAAVRAHQDEQLIQREKEKRIRELRATKTSPTKMEVPSNREPPRKRNTRPSYLSLLGYGNMGGNKGPTRK